MADDFLLGSSALQGSIMASNGRFDAELGRLSAIATKNPEKMNDRELREIAKDFESLLIRQLLKEMRKTVPQDGFLEYSNATEMYQEMGDDALANGIAEQGGLGIGELVYQQLKESRDNLHTAQDIVEKQDQFVTVHRRDGEVAPTQFKPLHKKQDPATDAKPLQKGHDPIPLPEKNGFMKFERPIVPLDRIEKR
jgi:flagellar protein FlgJ